MSETLDVEVLLGDVFSVLIVTTSHLDISNISNRGDLKLGNKISHLFLAEVFVLELEMRILFRLLLEVVFINSSHEIIRVAKVLEEWKFMLDMT